MFSVFVLISLIILIAIAIFLIIGARGDNFAKLGGAILDKRDKFLDKGEDDIHEKRS